MEICEGSGHGEIVHNERNCPLCELVGQNEELEKEKDELTSQITALEADVANGNDALTDALEEKAEAERDNPDGNR